MECIELVETRSVKRSVINILPDIVADASSSVAAPSSQATLAHSISLRIKI